MMNKNVKNSYGEICFFTPWTNIHNQYSTNNDDVTDIMSLILLQHKIPSSLDFHRNIYDINNICTTENSFNHSRVNIIVRS